MSVNEKIIQWLDYKGISQRQFTKKTGMSEGVLRRGKSIGADKLKIIKTIYPAFPFDWVIFDEGNLTNEQLSLASEDGLIYQVKHQSKENLMIKAISAQEALIKCQAENISLMKQLEALTKSNQ